MMIEYDSVDRKILDALQKDGRLTNNELAEQVGLSPSQCSRRRTRLEESGLIRGYHAHLDRELAGIGLVSMLSITLNSHNADNAKLFRRLVQDSPSVLEAHALTGEMDYLLKLVASDLKSLSEFINNVLLPHESIAQVKTAIVLDTLKESTCIPVRGK